MKRPSWGKRGYSLQEIDKSLNAIYAAHEKAPNHPVFSNRVHPDAAEMSTRLNAVAKSEKPTVRDVLQARGGVPMSQDEFKKRLK